ncbi:MAG TPA: CBS domain-containing protein [Pseudobdellovibrionaceae bacterium]
MITPVKKVMTKKLLTIPVGTSLFEAHEVMKENRIRHLPVVDATDDVLGILSQRDLNAIPDSKNIPVEWMMSSPVEYVDQNISLRKAILLMLQKKISCLLIADEKENAVGIVTTDDLLWHLANLLSDETENKPLLSFIDKQTIGEVANELSMMGI